MTEAAGEERATTGSLSSKLPGAPDRFDPARLRLPQDFTMIGVKKALVEVPVRKPNKQEFIRVRPGNEWRLETVILELKDEGESYLVDKLLWDELSIEIVPKVLFTTISRQGVLCIWPIKLPLSDGRLDSWNRSALAAAERAMTRWIRLVSNRSHGAYEVYEASAEIPEPEWPDANFQSLIQIAFRDKFIDSIDHPIIRRLRGRS